MIDWHVARNSEPGIAKAPRRPETWNERSRGNIDVIAGRVDMVHYLMAQVMLYGGEVIKVQSRRGHS